MSLKRLTTYVGALSALVCLSACATTAPIEPVQERPFYPENDPNHSAIIKEAEPLVTLPAPPKIPAPRARIPAPPEERIVETPLWYDSLVGWQEADHRRAYISFFRSCKSWKQADPDKALNPNLPDYGSYRDWLPACAKLRGGLITKEDAQEFFESEFAPLTLSTASTDEGLLTGYYEPEINVKLKADSIYYEPILAEPRFEKITKLPRSKITPASSRVIAYGKPIDVFFMQVQGSGRLRYADGRVLRAAYAANNGFPYKSIGRALVNRGEMTLSQASKQSIENWMNANGPLKTRALMNENPRYIFFKEQAINRNEGPRGAMEVPLTSMASIAVDPRYHPYGTLVWLETTLPQFGGDYKGQKTQVLVSAQDTGSAIKGPLRGDLFFGSGAEAGNKAGVMKHPVKWTILVPKSIAPRGAPIS